MKVEGKIEVSFGVGDERTFAWRGEEVEKKIDPFRGRFQRLPVSTGKLLIPIKYRNCNFFSVS